jgi:hypothetical protein
MWASGCLPTVPVMDAQVSRNVRLGIVITLAAPQLVVGLWAVLSPRGWYEGFPGIGPDLVAAEPPFNAHLATDAGAGFLATGAALAVAVLWGRRSGVHVALVGYLAFAVPHLAYHALNPAPGLTGAEDLLNVALLISGPLLALAFDWASRIGPPPPDRVRSVPERQPAPTG